jgi:hypothetical protein
MMEKLGGEDIQIAFSNEITNRMKVDNLFARLAGLFGISEETIQAAVPTDFECLDSLISTYSRACGRMSDYDL